MKKILLTLAFSGTLFTTTVSANETSAKVTTEKEMVELSWLDSMVLRIVTSPRPIRH